MDQENIMFFKNHNIFFGYKDSYYYYDIDVDKILLFVKKYD